MYINRKRLAGGGFASDLEGVCASSLYPTRLKKEEQVK
jgi:hypothetical protein